MIAPEQTYLAKINLIMAVIFSFVIVSDLVFAFLMFGQDEVILPIVLATTVVVAVVFTVMLLPRRYTLKKDHLEIRSTFSRERISYTSIRAATSLNSEPQANPLLPEHFKLEMADGSADQAFPAPGPAKKFLAELTSRIEAQRPTSA